MIDYQDLMYAVLIGFGLSIFTGLISWLISLVTRMFIRIIR